MMEAASPSGVVADRMDLGAHPGHADEHLKTAALIFRAKAIELYCILPQVQVGVERGRLPRFQAGKGIAGSAAGIAHAAAIDHRQIRRQMAYRPFEIVKHRQLPFYFF